jgi:hypothetical protein
MFLKKKTQMIEPSSALPGRDAQPFPIAERHVVLGTPLKPPFPEGIQVAVFAAAGRRLLDGRGIRRRIYTQPHLRRSL